MSPTRPRSTPPPRRPKPSSAAIVHAADHPRRREYWVGGSTVATLLGNAVAPGVLDRYLARTGFDAQQTEQAHDPGDPGNLWRPADGEHGQDYGAHGEFDAVAKSRSWQVLASQHHTGLAAAAGVGALALGLIGRRRISGRRGSGPAVSTARTRGLLRVGIRA